MKPTHAKTKHRGKHLTKPTKRRVSKAARRAAKPEMIDMSALSLRLDFINQREGRV